MHVCYLVKVKPKCSGNYDDDDDNDDCDYDDDDDDDGGLVVELYNVRTRACLCSCTEHRYAHTITSDSRGTYTKRTNLHGRYAVCCCCCYRRQEVAHEGTHFLRTLHTVAAG